MKVLEIKPAEISLQELLNDFACQFESMMKFLLGLSAAIIASIRQV